MTGSHSYPGEPKKPIFHKHYNTIGEFYEHILDALTFLTNHGKHQTIFSGEKSKQLSFDFHFGRHGRLFNVTDFQSAKRAIKQIIAEGEGSSPCNPLDWSNNKGDLSHYFLFKSIVERHQIKVYNISNDSNDGKSIHFLKVSIFFLNSDQVLCKWLWKAQPHRYRLQRLMQCAIIHRTTCNRHLTCPSLFGCFTFHVI